ncbi:MAG TPA: DUF302 domain-containing protein [Candidatus Acidoferrales bacterium]|nr:DUF302 domain-containing protein [Candidatus Acidoferrales bacterium]
MTRRDDLRTLQSETSFNHVVERLHDIVRERGLTLFADIDHAQNARDAGLMMPNTRVLIFGNAKAGTPLMLAAPDIALELPLRVLVRERSETVTELVYVDPDRLALEFGVAELAGPIAGLRAIVEAAARS